MLWKKPAGMKYTELCIYIDQNMDKIITPGEYPEVEEKIFNYLYLLIKALAIKKRMFTSFQDYDGYAFYAATRIFFALRKNQLNQGQVIKGKQIRPIKSCLNYVKALLYPMKVEYQQETYKEVIDEEFVSKKFDAMLLQQNAKQEIRENSFYLAEFKSLIVDVFQNLDSVLTNILAELPFKADSLEYQRIKISILLSCYKHLRLKNKLTYGDISAQLWQLPRSMSSYVTVLINEFLTDIKQSIMECYSSAVPTDDLIDKILTYKEGTDYTYEE